MPSLKKPTPVFHGQMSDDGSRFTSLASERGAREAYFRTLAGKHIDVIIREHKDTRSERANAYYWSGVLTPMSQHSSAGDQSPEEIHDAMCVMFLPDEPKRHAFFNRMTGEVIGVESDTRRSSKLAGDEFYEFVQKVRKFAQEFMGLETDDPDPAYWRKRASVAA